eukprot:TRINITY_DN13072_c0_g1_i1.p1 TRINITY_DN13072_c0_g1~~TRINITY_DN13072_c0_g1_i1.p1  ORF type:complete len:850 (+),score=253.12 TRINITY_DN13072_c0_g1_i1:36-2585(+)
MTVSGADREEQSDELLALSGILDTTAFSHSESQCGGHKGVLEVVVRVPGAGLIEIVRGHGKPNFTVKYLPPVKLEFTLPADYPSQACPLYCITCPWLLEVQRKMLEDQLRNLWDEQGGGVILFTWLNFLQEDLLEFLGVVSQIDISAFTERTISVNEETKTACDKNDNLKLIDDDELRTSPESDDSKHVEEDPSLVIAPNNDVIPSVVEAGDKAPTTCSVLQWDVSKQCGVLDTVRGEALVKHSSIVGHNVNKLEASLEVGEKVECRLEEMNSKWEGVNRTLEAFDVSGAGGRMVRGSKKGENVKVLEEDVMGSVVRWSKRARDGMLRGPKGDVYVYYTCVQGEGSLCKGDKVVFHVVESQKWGVLASFVRKWKEDGMEREEEIELNRMRNERDKRVQNVGSSEPANLTGWVKKWNDGTGKGIIRSEGGKEWSFTSKDCLVKGEVGFKLFSKGDRVTFEQNSDNHGATPRATSVMLAGELDSGVGSNNSSVDLPPVHHVDKDMVDNSVEVKEFKGEKEKLSVDPALPGTSGKQEKPVENPVIPKRVRRHSNRQQQLATLLREFNNMKEEEEFAVSLNSCLICFTDKIGSQCLMFVVCNHVYCRDCMANYFKEKISTGAVSSLMCPTFKCETQALPNQVAELVQPDLFQKYESLLLETQLESMTDIVSCPRVVCQCPTIIDRETNMGQCPACQLAFCIYCKATYHGVSPCKFKSTEQRAILERYNNSTGDEKTFLEKRYGKKQLATMSATLASEDYMASHARQCPHCNAPIEKNEGCNKITCWRCNTHFCWLCGLKLPQVNPYTHFNVQGGKCFGALFQGVDPLDGDDEFDDFFDEDDDWQAVQAALLGV